MAKTSQGARSTNPAQMSVSEATKRAAHAGFVNVVELAEWAVKHEMDAEKVILEKIKESNFRSFSLADGKDLINRLRKNGMKSSTARSRLAKIRHHLEAAGVKVAKDKRGGPHNTDGKNASRTSPVATNAKVPTFLQAAINIVRKAAADLKDSVSVNELSTLDHILTMIEAKDPKAKK